MRRRVFNLGVNSVITGDANFEPADGEGYCTHIYEIDLKVKFSGTPIKVTINSLNCKLIKECTEEKTDCTERIQVTTQGCGDGGSQTGSIPPSTALCETVKKLLNEEEITDLGDVLFVLTESIGLVKDSEEDELSGVRSCLEEVCESFAEGGPAPGEPEITLNIRCCEDRGTCNPDPGFFEKAPCDDEDDIDLYIESENFDLGGGFSFDIELGEYLPLDVSTEGGNFCCYLGCPPVEIPLGLDRGGECNITRFLDHPDCVNLPHSTVPLRKDRAECALEKAMECWSNKQSECADRNCPR